MRARMYVNGNKLMIFLFQFFHRPPQKRTALKGGYRTGVSTRIFKLGIVNLLSFMWCENIHH